MGRGFSNQIQIDRNAKQILGEDLKNVKVEEWTDDDNGIRLLVEAGLVPGTEQFANALNKLQENETFGLVFGKTILTQNYDAMSDDLAKGKNKSWYSCIARA